MVDCPKEIHPAVTLPQSDAGITPKRYADRTWQRLSWRLAQNEIVHFNAAWFNG